MTTTNRNYILLAVIALIVMVGIVWFRSKDSGDSSPRLISIEVVRPDMVVKSNNLSRVEVWYVPTGNEITESDFIKIGDPNLDKDASISTEQIWKISIPENPFLATDIFAKGFDNDGAEVSEVYLKEKGASEIYEALWLAYQSRSVTLGIGDIQNVGDVKIKLIGIKDDSRCPKGVQCIQAGKVVADVLLQIGDKSKNANISSNNEGYSFEGYFIKLEKVLPEAVAGKKLYQGEYRLEFSVIKDTK